MFPLKTAQFAEVILIGESLSDAHDGTGGIPVDNESDPNGIVTHTVGLTINLRFNENLGSSQKNVIGTPVPIFIPGFYQGTISCEKATLDLKSWKTMVNINPYTAYVPSTYDIEGKGLDYTGTPFEASGQLAETENKIPRFLFGLYVYDRIQQEASRPTGMYLCMLQSYNTALTANDSVIMEDVSFLARPVEGSWFGVLRNTYNLNTFFGYAPKILPQRGTSNSTTRRSSGSSGGGPGEEELNQ